MQNASFISKLSILSLVFILFSCHKLEFPDEDSKAILGTWRYVSSSGGLSGSGAEGLNQNHSIEFSDKGIYKLFEGSTQLEKSKFRLERRESISGMERTAIIYHTGSSRTQSFDVVGDTLFLYDEFYDGFNYVYLKN